MNAAVVEVGCRLRSRVVSFTWLYWWLEYWGDWLGPEGDRSLPGIDLSPMAKAIMRGKDYIRATAGKSYPTDIDHLEKALSPLKLHEAALCKQDSRRTNEYRILYRLHNRKWGLRQIEEDEGIDWYTLDRKLVAAYTVVQVNLFARDPSMRFRQSPILREPGRR